MKFFQKQAGDLEPREVEKAEMSSFKWKRPVKQSTWMLLFVFFPTGIAIAFLGKHFGSNSYKFAGVCMMLMGLTTSMGHFVGSRFEMDIDEDWPTKLLMVALFVGFIGGGLGLFMAWNSGFEANAGVVLAGFSLFFSLIVLPSIASFLHGAIRGKTPDEVVADYEEQMRMLDGNPHYDDDRVVGGLTRHNDKGG